MVRAVDVSQRNGDVLGCRVIGTVLRCMTIQISVHYDQQIERHSITDDKPVKIVI